MYLWLIHAAGWQKPTQHCKAIILPLKFFKNLTKQRKQDEKHNLLQKSGESQENSPVLDGVHTSPCRPLQSRGGAVSVGTTGGWLWRLGQPHPTPVWL